MNRVKSLDCPRVCGISIAKEKVYGGKNLLKSQILSSEWNTERVREDASGDSEDNEDYENNISKKQSRTASSYNAFGIVTFLVLIFKFIAV